MIKVKTPTILTDCDSGSGEKVLRSIVSQDYAAEKLKNCGFDGALMIVCIEASEAVEAAILADDRFEVVE